MQTAFRSVSTKIMSITAVVAAVMLLSSLATFMIIRGEARDFEHAVNVNIANEQEITKITLMFKTQVQEWKNVLLRGSDAEQMKKYWGSFESEEAQIQSSGKNLGEKIENKEVVSLLKEFLEAHTAMGEAYRKGKQAFIDAGFNSTAGDKAVKGIDRKPTELLTQAAEKLRVASRTSVDETIAKARRGAVWALVLFVVAVFVGMFAIQRRMQVTIAQPTQALLSDLLLLAEGDFSRESQFHSNDEMGLIADSARQVQHRLGDLITQLRAAVLKVAATAKQLQSLTSASNASVSVQRDQSDQVATATNEMAATVQDVARSAEQAAASAERADTDARSGHGVVQRTVESIGQLSDDLTNAANVISELEKDSDSIGTVLDVIRGIAEQTNLLALNAAIEAARAGEQGRGFAVVADEVRTLASKTQQSTQEIHAMIERLQGRTGSAVSVMNSSCERVKSTVAKANEAATALSSITQSVARIHEMNTHIASAAEEQGAVAAEINKNVVHIRDGISVTADNATQMAAMSEELRHLAATVEHAVEQFRVKGQ